MAITDIANGLTGQLIVAAYVGAVNLDNGRLYAYGKFAGFMYGSVINLMNMFILTRISHDGCLRLRYSQRHDEFQRTKKNYLNSSVARNNLHDDCSRACFWRFFNYSTLRTLSNNRMFVNNVIFLHGNMATVEKKN